MKTKKMTNDEKLIYDVHVMSELKELPIPFIATRLLDRHGLKKTKIEVMTILGEYRKHKSLSWTIDALTGENKSPYRRRRRKHANVHVQKKGRNDFVFR